MFFSVLFSVLLSVISIDAEIVIENAENESIEYSGIGKFNSYDFYDKKYRRVTYLPQSPAIIGTKFLLYTPTDLRRDDPRFEGTELYNENLASIQNSDFDPKLETKIIVHGLIDDLIIGGWMRQIKDGYLKRGKYNIIIVDWSLGNGLPYGQATVNTRVVGALIANLIKDLQAVHHISFQSVHIIGHSLGSHIAGYAGERLHKLGRITGLDPAGPFFENTVPACRLDPTDADFVDSIHTSATYGMVEDVSHIDVYVNGGGHQPGCTIDRLLAFINGGVVEGIKQLTSCNHQRAIDYYISSLNQKNIPIVYHCKDEETFLKTLCFKCGENNSQCAKFGPGIEEWKKFRVTDEPVRMYLKTSSKPPYFLNQYKIEVKLSSIEGHGFQHGYLMVTLRGDSGSEFLVLSDKDETLKLGNTMTYFKDVKKDIGVLRSVTFEWHRSLTFFTAETYLESISVTPLFITDQTQGMEETVKFCPFDPKVSVNHDTEVEFAKC